MNINKYTEKAREAVAAAIELARQHNNPQLEPEHLLVTLVEQRDGIIPELLRKMNVDPEQLARAARELIAKIPSAYGGSGPRLSPRRKKKTTAAGGGAARPEEEDGSTHQLFLPIAGEGGRAAAAPV